MASSRIHSHNPALLHWGAVGGVQAQAEQHTSRHTAHQDLLVFACAKGRELGDHRDGWETLSACLQGESPIQERRTPIHESSKPGNARWRFRSLWEGWCYPRLSVHRRGGSRKETGLGTHELLSPTPERRRTPHMAYQRPAWGCKTRWSTATCCSFRKRRRWQS